MLVRFVVSRFGLELIAYESPDIPLNVDPDILSGMLQAMESIGAELHNPIQEIKFSNWVIYIRPYSEYTIRLILTDHISKEQADEVFENLNNKVMSYFPQIQSGQTVPEETIRTDFLPCLQCLIHEQSPLSEIPQEISDSAVKRSLPQFAKIAMAGLGAVGKTSIKNLFMNHVTPKEAADTRPTLGVDVNKKDLEYLEGQMAIHEFGGQAFLRARYLQNKSMWLGMAALIYVVDLQKPENFIESRDYLRAIWNLLAEANPKLPVLSIFLHKYDPAKRKEMAPLLKSCLNAFTEFQSIGTFHLTAIEDRSSNTAIIKTIYLSLPSTILENMLDEGFYQDFNTKLLPQFVPLITDDSIVLDEDILSEIRSSAILAGRGNGAKLQKSWIKYLSGENGKKEKHSEIPELQIKKVGKEFQVTIKKNHQFPNLSKIVLDGVLTGMTKSLQFTAPKIKEESLENITWQFGI